ncbi:MAG: glycosyltransferase family 1 protein [Microgenomates group bacterium]
MRAPVYIYDPTSVDVQSKVRGIGRYLQILRENTPSDWIFTDSLTDIPSHAILIQPFYTFYQQPLITKRITDRQIAVIHDVIPFKYKEHFPIGIKAWFYSFLQKNNLRFFDRIITDSEVSKTDIQSFLNIPKEKISVLYPTLARCFWDSSRQHSSHGDYCIYVGDGTWNKNLSKLAVALKKTNSTCMFVGKIFQDTNPEHYSHPWQDDLRQFFEEAQNHKQFIFTGFVTDEELVNLYSKAAYNLLLSHDEGFGFSFVEAAACGCPSLLNDKPIFREIAKDSAEYVDGNDADAIAEKIKQLTSNEKKRSELSFKALEQSKKYSAESFKKKVIEAIYPY